ncbi:MAG: NAD-dependent epimerase/dehydratase family protein [Flavobacteriaceae bacterium]|nr:NAD-dependent epimerase/dehydratase family protein [Flavobacteriaceae bacterium]MBT3919545.1 NAD-dependent epimerase/dehydratase family protein [Flavobacteriaceae bacterium]MBT6706236.1 NAD-dependent epimerase/dehydratase family protein [Flavobacteriaceae bacterium]MBT7243261.1 NAD-dependent epimerase/dehydratase family protein [Flavobacteriaceae bacterium]
MNKIILIIGASGQIGTELTMQLRKKYGNQNVVATDIREDDGTLSKDGPFEVLDAMDYQGIESIVIKYKITDVYLLAAMLSATAEKFPMRAWNLNMNSLFNVLNLARDQKIKKVFWPSSIAVFGPSSPKENTPQRTIMEPSTVYGISKQAGERWCEYYHNIYGVDVRSIRYPGLISYKTPPGGGTTDYAVAIYHQAIKGKNYVCFLDKQTTLPMMYIDDAIRATLTIMDAPKESIKIRSSYNLSGLSFNPIEISESIKQQIPSFEISYKPDFRQKIADSWPKSIDDTDAKNDWRWKNNTSLEEITAIMLKNLQD